MPNLNRKSAISINDSINKNTTEYIENILIVDDEQLHLHSLKELISFNNHKIECVDSGKDAIEKLKTKKFGLVILDLNMEGITGHDVMIFLNENNINTTVIIVSGETSFEAVKKSLKYGAYDFIRKPYAIDNLLNSIKNAIKKRHLEYDNIEMQKKLQRSEKLHRYIVNKSPDIVYMLDSNGCFTFVNNRIYSLLGYNKKEILGMHYTSIVHEDDINKADSVFNERRTGNRSSSNVEIRLNYNKAKSSKQSEEHILSVEVTAVGVYSSNKDNHKENKFIGTYGTARDITDRIEAEEIIRFQAYHDMLTRLPNRTLLKDRLNQAISQTKRNNKKLAILFLDLDRFKVINDTLGHLVGDQLLQAVSLRLKTCLREGDTLARIGGDEFTVLLPEINNKNDSKHVAEKIIDALNTPFKLDGNELFVSTSIGIAHYPEDGENIETLIKHADMAMYYIKDNGKNGFQFYRNDMDEAYSKHMSMENDMRRALKQQQFEVYYQPQVNIETNETFAMEALVRWNHPQRGIISPSDFIPLAEETGLIRPLGEWVLRRACKELKGWHDIGLNTIRIAVNLSSCQLEQDDIVESIINILNEYEISGDMLEIEITENILMKDIENSIQKLKQLHEFGIKIAIDDFGTGYSSLNYLKKLPIDTLKIDRSFINDMQKGNGDASIIKAIITMAHDLNLNIISEGVETIEQLEQLKAWRCKNMQGFLFGRPMVNESTITYLQQEKAANL